MIKIPVALVASTTLPVILFCIGIISGLCTLLSVCMIIRGIIKRKSKKYLLCWLVTFVIAVLLSFLTVTGQLVRVS